MSRTYSLGILFKDNAMCGLTHDYFAGILNGFKLQSEEQGYEITFINAGTRHDNKTLLGHIKDRKIEGVGIICTDLNDPEVKELLGSDIPLVTIDEPYDGIISILSDNEQGIRNLVYHIAGMGHKKIAYIHGDMNSVTNIRINGFKDACKKMGIEVPNEYIRECNYRDTKKASFETEALMRLPDPPTCIIYPDDYAAIGGINILKAYGLSIPDDISIAGYDGIDIPSRYDPKITTIRQDMDGMGRTAARILISLIDSPESITGRDDIIIETSLSEGNTVRHIIVEE
jgi:DNA-binding LacI/PurR family transcriptional regulator